jgi:hypothetical protein
MTEGGGAISPCPGWRSVTCAEADVSATAQTVRAKHELLSAVDATGDLTNINPTSGTPCALLPSLIEYLVPLDNNLGLSEWTVA